MSEKRQRAHSGEPSPPSQRKRFGGGTTDFEALPDEIYPVIFALLSTRSLLRLTRSSKTLASKVHNYLGYRYHVVVNPLAPAHLSFPVVSQSHTLEHSPPIYTPQGAAYMHGRLYVPSLSTDPKCHVLTLDTFQWSCFPITVMPAPNELLARTTIEFTEEPVQGPLDKRLWGPLTTSVTACSSTGSLYFYGGVRKPLQTTDFPFNAAGSAGSTAAVGSGGTVTSGGTLGSDDTAPSESVDGDGSLRLSSDLFRLDVPMDYVNRTNGGDDEIWRLNYLGNAAHPYPVATALRQATPPYQTRKGSTSPASSPLFNLNLDVSSPMKDIMPESKSSASHTSTSLSTASTSISDLSILNMSKQRSSDTSETSVEEEDQIFRWPEARRDHSFDCVSDEFLVVFGGRSRRGEEHSDAWAYELATGLWSPVSRVSAQPRLQYSHASAVIGTDIYVFGGCQTDSPLIIHDALSRLSCVGKPTNWFWHNFNSPALYQPIQRKKRPSLPPVEEEAMTAVTVARPVPQTIFQNRGRSSSGSTVSMRSMNSEQVMQEMQISDEAYRVIEGISTIGQSPIERFSASLVALGSHHLAVIGGLTVEEGVEPGSGLVFDEFCACHISAIDIFDIERNHWMSLRPSQTSPCTKPVLADYLLDSAAVGQPPSHDNSSWSIVVAGRALDLEEYEVAGDDYGLAAASARNSIARGDDGGCLFDWLASPQSEYNPSQLRMDPVILLELHLSRLQEDEMSERFPPTASDTAVRYYERDGVTCLASTFSRRTTVQPPMTIASASEHRGNQVIGGPYPSHRQQPRPTFAGISHTDAPAVNYPTGVFNTDSGSVSDGSGSRRSHVGTRQVIRVIKFS